MRTRVILIAFLLLSANSSSAKDMNGKAGIGFVQTLGGVSGFSFRYWASKHWGIETVFGASLIDRADRQSSTTINTAIGVLYSIAQHRHTNLSLGLRMDVGFRDAPTWSQGAVSVGSALGTEDASSTAEIAEPTFHLNLEIPVIAEFFMSDNFSIHLAVGLVIVFVPDEGAILETSGPGATIERDELGIGVGAGGLLGTAGFTFYF